MAYCWRTRWIRRIAAACTLGMVAWLGISAIACWKLTRRPHAMVAEPAPAWEGIPVESHRLKAIDGQEIGAWYLPTDQRPAGVIIVHGLGGSRSDLRELIRAVRDRGNTVLAISARAHGDSTGDSHDVGYSARHDVHAAIQFLRQHRPGRPVVVLGKSFGAAAAVFDAADSRGLVDGYFLQSPYRDLDTAVWNRIDIRLPSPLKQIAYAGLHLWTPVFISEAAKIRPVDRVSDIAADIPVVIFASRADRLARLEESEELHSRISGHGRLVTVPDAPHEQVFKSNKEAYMQALAALLEHVERPAAERR